MNTTLRTVSATWGLNKCSGFLIIISRVLNHLNGIFIHHSSKFWLNSPEVLFGLASFSPLCVWENSSLITFSFSYVIFGLFKI